MPTMTYLQAIGRGYPRRHPEPRFYRGEGSAFSEVNP